MAPLANIEFTRARQPGKAVIRAAMLAPGSSKNSMLSGVWGTQSKLLFMTNAVLLLAAIREKSIANCQLPGFGWAKT